mmetsp:Transcript_42166/g.100089  ORF Transcript_42166/g.100089 Transcript_42166/m.100089 type:complete len:213 (+) Transcript_42166:461-1099(+)
MPQCRCELRGGHEGDDDADCDRGRLEKSAGAPEQGRLRPRWLLCRPRLPPLPRRPRGVGDAGGSADRSRQVRRRRQHMLGASREGPAQSRPHVPARQGAPLRRVDGPGDQALPGGSARRPRPHPGTGKLQAGEGYGEGEDCGERRLQGGRLRDRDPGVHGLSCHGPAQHHVQRDHLLQPRGCEDEGQAVYLRPRGLRRGAGVECDIHQGRDP